MAKLDWEAAARRDLVREHGSEPVWNGLSKPKAKTAKAKRSKAKQQAEASRPARKTKAKKPANTSTSRQRKASKRGLGPVLPREGSPARVALTEFRRLSKAERSRQLPEYRRRIEAYYAELEVPLVNPDRLETKKEQQLELLRGIASGISPVSNKQLERVRNTKRKKVLTEVQVFSRPNGYLRISWPKRAGVTRWHVAVVTRNGMTVETREVTHTEARFSNLRKSAEPFSIRVRGSGASGEVIQRLNLRGVRVFNAHGSKKSRKGGKSKARKTKGRGSVKNPSASSGRRPRVRLIS